MEEKSQSDYMHICIAVTSGGAPFARRHILKILVAGAFQACVTSGAGRNVHPHGRPP